MTTTAASLAWFPRCEHSSPNGALTWACPLHDPLLQSDCAGCTEREQRRAGEIRAAREQRRARETETHTEEIEMPKPGTGFWSGDHVGEDGKSMPRLELARLLIAEGKSKAEIERTLGASPNTLCKILKADERKHKPVARQPQPQPRPAGPVGNITGTVDPEEVGQALRSAMDTLSGATEARERERARQVCEEHDRAIDDLLAKTSAPPTPGPGPGQADLEQMLQHTEQTTEQAAAGILQAFAESDAAATIALVFEFLEYKQLEAECELFIRFGLWRAQRAAG